MIDTHAHLDFSQFDQDREKVIQRAFLNGVKKIINVGCNLERAKASIKLAEKYDNIYAAVGIHPSDVKSITNYELRITNSEETKKQSSIQKQYINEIQAFAQHPKVVAIGEIGLDYFRIDGDDYNVETRHCLVSTLEKIKKMQKEMFIAQLELARELDLPVIIHCRPSDESGDAYDDLLDICRDRSRPVPTRGVIHCFSGTREHAQQFLDFRLYISFTGNITYPKKSDAEILQVVREVPLEKILIETDCPFLSPVPMRGKRNEPLFVKYVAEKIAEIKGVDFEEVERVTDENAEKLFGI